MATKIRQITEQTACQICGLCEKAQTYRMFPERDTRQNSQGKPLVLVVGSHPHADDDRVGVPFYSSKSGGDFLRDYLNAADFRWVLTHAARCYPGTKANGEAAHPSARQYRICVDYELRKLIKQLKPAAIVLLGEPTMHRVLGDVAPKTLSRAIGNTFVLELEDDLRIPVTCGIDPSVHVMWLAEKDGGKNLADHYGDLFEKAQKLAVEGYTRKHYKYTLIDSSVDFLKLAQKLGPVISFDWEFVASEAIHGMRTYWHEGSEGRCVVITDHHPKIPGEYRNYIIPSRLLRRKDIWKQILSGRKWRGQNIQVEIQCFWIYCGFCVYDLIPHSLKEEKPDGSFIIHDTMLWTFAQDHGVFGIGLKPMSRKLRGVEDWSLEADREIEEKNKQIAQEHTALNKEISKVKKILLSEEITDELKTPFEEKYLALKKQRKELRPKGSAHFGDPSDPVIWEYNAGDGENTHWLADFQIENGWEPQYPLDELLQRSLYITTMVEREGLPVDTERLNKLHRILDQKYNNYLRELIRDDRIRGLLKTNPKLVDAKARKELTRKVLYEEMSPSKNTFLQNVAEVLGDLGKVPYKVVKRKDGTQKILYKFDEAVIEDLCGGEADTKPQHRKPTWTEPDAKTQNQKIWTYIFGLRQVFGLRNKVKEYARYTVNDRVRPNFRLAKVDAETGDSQDRAGGTATGRLSCIAKGTLIQGAFDRRLFPNGKPIEQVEAGDWLYSYNSDGKLLLRQAEWAGKTGHRKTIKIRWKAGGHHGQTGELCLTPEHLVRMLNGKWKRADKLKPKDRIMSLSTGVNGYGYVRLWAVGGIEIPQEHRFIGKQLGVDLDGKHVHHVDGCKVNNHPTNLISVTPQEHVNHEVVEIVEGPTIDVYDITMLGDEPCFIANGLAVHNSTKINSQNIKKDPFLRWIFSSHVYGSDWLLAEADYDRGEPVCLAVVANIKAWKEVFRKGWDLYQVIANEIYDLGISLEGDPDEVNERLQKVPKELRENAKTRTLAIMYGESARAFAERANIKLEDALHFYQRFDRLYPEIGRYKKRIELRMLKGKKVLSPFKRPRNFCPKLPKRHPKYRYQFSKNLLQAINFPIQSMLSDICLWKAKEVHAFLKKRGLLDKVRIFNLVHDSVWIAVHRSAAWVLPEIQKILEDVSTLPLKNFDIPLRNGFKLGRHLGAMKEVKDRLKRSPQSFDDWLEAVDQTMLEAT